MSKRAYPHKGEDEKRVIVSFSVSGKTLKSLRQRLEQYMHAPPSRQEIQSFARGLAYDAVETYLTSPLAEDDQVDVNR